MFFCVSESISNKSFILTNLKNPPTIMKEIKLWYNNSFVFMTHHENESTIVEVVNKLFFFMNVFFVSKFCSGEELEIR